MPKYVVVHHVSVSRFFVGFFNSINGTFQAKIHDRNVIAETWILNTLRLLQESKLAVQQDW